MREVLQQHEARGDVAAKSIAAEIGLLLSRGLREVMRSPGFQALESSWRGLQHLVTHTRISASLRIAILDVTKEELHQDFADTREIEDTALYGHVLTAPFTRDTPFSLLIGAFSFSHDPDDVAVLGGLARIAALACVLFAAAGDTALLRVLPANTSTGGMTDVPEHTPEYAVWTALRDDQASIHAALVLPRFLARLPHSGSLNPVPNFEFEECQPDETSAHCWMSGVFVVAQRIAELASTRGWCTSIRQQFGTGIAGLPTYEAVSSAGTLVRVGPCELAFTPTTAQMLYRRGLVALHDADGRGPSINYVPSLWHPRKYDRPETTDNARFRSMLPCTMAASRVMHHQAVIACQRIEMGKSLQDVEATLNRWGQDYVNPCRLLI